MAFIQFPDKQYFRVLNSDSVTRFGYFNLASGIEIQHMMFTLFVRNTIATPFQFRANIYGNNLQEDAIFTSSWATLSAATLINKDTGLPYVNNWLGNIYVDFAGQPLNPNINYFMSIETSGYTRNGDTFYLGVNLDWYSEVNTQLNGPDEAGARIRILGYR